MRLPFALFLAFTSSFAIAAPVKPDPKTERIKLESFWNDLHSYDPIVRVRAVLALVDHPHAAAFLDEKVRPLKVSKDQIEQWMKELNSDDENVRNRAFEELQYYIPQLHFNAAEQIELVTTNDAKRKLIGLWINPDWAARLEPNSQITLRVVRSNENSAEISCRWEYRTPRSSGSGECGPTVVSVQMFESQSWTATALAAIILDRIGSRSARGTLAKLANGNPDALPTRTAIALLQPGPPAPLTSKQFEIAWKTLAEGNPLAVARTAIAFSDDPDAAKFLKAKLPAIKAEKAQIKKWLADLGSEKNEVWRPAFESLKYFRPSLALTPDEQIAEMRDDRSRSMLVGVYHTFGTTPTTMDLYREVELQITEIEYIKVGYDAGGGRIIFRINVGTLETMTPLEWQRARLAIVALERSGTADSLEVLKQLAEGHPDILPTKEAKAAVKRLVR